MIKKNILGESLIGIIIAISLLGFVILGIANIISYGNKVNTDYNTSSTIDLLKDNTLTIVKKLDLDFINEGENFYLYRDDTNKNYYIFTGSENESYKYIDSFGSKVDILTFTGDTFYRTIKLEKKDLITSNNIFSIDVTKRK